MNSSDKNYHFK